jgi:hypothetical protein
MAFSFNQSSNFKNDCFQKTWRDKTNNIIADYSLYNQNIQQNKSYLNEPCLNSQIPPFAKTGYTNAESDLRNGDAGNVTTHFGARQQLNVRPYLTTPYMGSCRSPMLDVDTYSRISNGQTTRERKSMNSGTRAERFIPLVKCLKENIQNPSHIIPVYWTRGGLDTRANIRNSDYLKECGITNSVNPVQKQFCPQTRLSKKEMRQHGQTKNLPCFPDSCQVSRH